MPSYGPVGDLCKDKKYAPVGRRRRRKREREMAATLTEVSRRWQPEKRLSQAWERVWPHPVTLKATRVGESTS